MASITSLGVHSPSALPYLVVEGILPSNPSEALYRWQTVNSDGSDTEENLVGEEELVITDNCVVWSQSGIVRRLFRFDMVSSR